MIQTLNSITNSFPLISAHLLTESPPVPSGASEADSGAIILTGVLLNLVVIYLASKIGGELCKRFDLPPVLGELVGGVVVGISALHLIVFPEGGATESSSSRRFRPPGSIARSWADRGTCR